MFVRLTYLTALNKHNLTVFQSTQDFPEFPSSKIIANSVIMCLYYVTKIYTVFLRTFLFKNSKESYISILIILNNTGI